MTTAKYGVIHYPKDSYREICVPDGADNIDIEKNITDSNQINKEKKENERK